MTNKLILLFSLDKGLQSYFLLDICLITLAHHHWTFKQALSMFIDKTCKKIAFKGYSGGNLEWNIDGPKVQRWKLWKVVTLSYWQSIIRFKSSE